MGALLLQIQGIWGYLSRDNGRYKARGCFRVGRAGNGRQKELFDRYKVFCGISSGAALEAARAFAEETVDKGDIVIILPDSGNRYMI